MDEHFRKWFVAFARRHDVRLLSPLDFNHIRELVGEEVTAAATACYACRGNSVWVRGEELHVLDFTPPKDLYQFLGTLAGQSLFPLAGEPDLGRHYGQLRLRVLGRLAGAQARGDYREWDDTYHERVTWAREICSAYPHLRAQVTGDHCIDIFPAAADAEQVLAHISGDVIVIGSCNDPESENYRLARAAVHLNSSAQVYTSTDWPTTKVLIESLRPSGWGPST